MDARQGALNSSGGLKRGERKYTERIWIVDYWSRDFVKWYRKLSLQTIAKIIKGYEILSSITFMMGSYGLYHSGPRNFPKIRPLYPKLREAILGEKIKSRDSIKHAVTYLAEGS